MSNSSMGEVVQTPMPLLEQGIDLMLYGMGVVFVFLAVLVTAITLISFIIHRFWPEGEAVETLSEDSVPSLKARGGETLLKILQNAVDQHRGRH